MGFCVFQRVNLGGEEKFSFCFTKRGIFGTPTLMHAFCKLKQKGALGTMSTLSHSRDSHLTPCSSEAGAASELIKEAGPDTELHSFVCTMGLVYRRLVDRARG